MEEKISKVKYLSITALIFIFLFLNLIFWHSQLVGFFAGLFFLIFYSFIFGSIFIAKKGWQLLYGLLFLLSLIGILGGLLIYFYHFNNSLYISILIFVPAILFAPYYHFTPKEKLNLKKIFSDYLSKFNERKEPKANFFLVIAYLILFIFALTFLIVGKTTTSIQSPWQVVSGRFFMAYFLATAFLSAYVLNARRTKLPLALLVIHTFLSTGVAVIVYQIGYGFDPFIHQATEKIIAATGTITPKPLYYLGQYAIVVFLNKLTLINIELIDRLLVPLTASLFLPLTTYFVFSHWLKKNHALILALAILVIPFSGFIMTAPQNLANLFFIITILLSILYFRGNIKITMLYLLAGCTTIIHPLAGIPLLICLALFSLFKFMFDSYRQYLSLFFWVALIFVIILPLVFIVNGSGLNLALPDIHRSDLNIINLVDKFDLPLNLAYFVYFNKIILAGAIIIIGLWYLAKHKLLKNNSVYLIASLIIFLSYLIIKYFLIFPDLRTNDQTDFVNRIKTLSFYILLPLFLIGIHIIIKSIWRKNWLFKAFTIFIMTGAITISFYLSYPRVNIYEPAKFFSVSESDIKAVKLIENIANPDHVVLANQMIGAAAIQEFGFKKYYANQFYYSMPMGSPQRLYDLYLEMVYQGAKKETMDKAMAEANVNEAYFVLNRYWKNSEKIAAQAALSAQEVYTIDNGTIYVYQYTRQ